MSCKRLVRTPICRFVGVIGAFSLERAHLLETFPEKCGYYGIFMGAELPSLR